MSHLVAHYTKFAIADEYEEDWAPALTLHLAGEEATGINISIPANTERAIFFFPPNSIRGTVIYFGWILESGLVITSQLTSGGTGNQTGQYLVQAVVKNPTGSPLAANFVVDLLLDSDYILP